MTEKKKLTTAEILAMARKQKAEEAGSSESPSPAEPAANPAQETAPAGDAAQEAKAEAPKSTADILAAARAQAAGAKPAPKSTADILAAARAQAAGEKPAAAAPKSTADILAAARGQSGAKSAGKAPEVAKSPAGATGSGAKPVGDRPALKEMVAAVKESQASGGVVKPKVPGSAKPKLPAKAEPVSRRGFWAVLSVFAISPFAVAWAAMAAIGGLWTLGIARFMMPNMVLELPSRFKVGPPSDFPPGTVSEKYKASRGIWIVNTDEYDGRGLIYALESICTHLGCTPNWLEGEQKYKCPCHGSGFYITGVNFEGPAPRPLERVGIRLAEDGMLEVDKSVKFQEEMGQWTDPKSYVNA